MACCAFAVYLLSQLLLPLAWLRDRLFGAPVPAVSQSAAWKAGAASTPPAARLPRWLLLLVGLEAVALVAGAATASPTADALYHAAMPAALCRALGGPQS